MNHLQTVCRFATKTDEWKMCLMQSTYCSHWIWSEALLSEAFFIQNPQINELFPLHLELRRLGSIQPLIVFNNSNYSIEKEHAIHHQSCHFGVRQWPLQARQLNHLVTLWMGSFVTVSCYDYYFVTLDPSDLNVSQGVKSSAHDNHKPWMCSHKSSSRQGDVRSGVFSNKVFWSTEGIFDSVHSQMWDFFL